MVFNATEQEYCSPSTAATFAPKPVPTFMQPFAYTFSNPAISTRGSTSLMEISAKSPGLYK
jgi:hypothetical protein